MSAKENWNCASNKKHHYLLFKKWQIHLVEEPPHYCNVGAACKVFPSWSQKTVTRHCLSWLFCIVSRLGYRTNWLLELGEVLHDPFRNFRKNTCNNYIVHVDAWSLSKISEKLWCFYYSLTHHTITQLNFNTVKLLVNVTCGTSEILKWLFMNFCLWLAVHALLKARDKTVMLNKEHTCIAEPCEAQEGEVG